MSSSSNCAWFRTSSQASLIPLTARLKISRPSNNKLDGPIGSYLFKSLPKFSICRMSRSSLSQPVLVASKPDGVSEASNTTAPAPSPNNTALSRRAQLMYHVIRSAAITTAFLIIPARICAVAACNAYKKPEHAAFVSIAAAPTAPMFFCTKEAVFATMVDGVQVARSTRSMSLPSTPAQARACFAATVAKSAVETWLTRRDLMPVRVVIHSSLVSTILLISSLLMLAGGIHLPQPVIWA